MPSEHEVDSVQKERQPYTPPLLEPQEQYLLVTGLSI